MKFNPECRSCRRLTNHLTRIKQKYPEYHCAPVDAFGDTCSSLLIVGLAPGLHGANRTARPFTGDASGDLLFRTLHKVGFSSLAESRAPDDGLVLRNCAITNAVRCLPPDNKPSARELALCARYLRTDLEAMKRPGVIVALGRQAHDSVLKVLGNKLYEFRFSHGAQHSVADDLILIDSYHCSRYNTQTRRLTPEMFEAVFRDASRLLEQCA